MSILPEPGAGAGAGALKAFRAGFYECLTARADTLFELADALLCSQGPVTSLPALSLAGVFRRGHGALYAALRAGRVDTDRLRNLLAGQPIGRVGGRIVLAVDVTCWLRPDANRSPGRLFCHVYGRGRSADQFIPGWPYSMVAALESGASSWTQILDAARIGPDDDVQAVTAAQVRGVIERLITAGQYAEGDEPILVVADAGYDAARLAWCLRDLPVTVSARVRTDRVFYARPDRQAAASGRGGRPPTIRTRFLGDALAYHRLRHRSLRQVGSEVVGSAASAADSAGRLDRRRRDLARPRWHPDTHHRRPPPTR